MRTETKLDLALSLAAQRLGLSWAQAWRLVLTRQLPAEKRGNRWFVAEKEVNRLLERKGAEMGGHEIPERDAVHD